MNNIEIINKYNPFDISECRAFSSEISIDKEGLHVILDCDIGKIELCFSGNVPAYLYSVEGIRVSSWAKVQEDTNDKYYFRKWFLYKIDNSDFLKWAIKESCGFYSEKELTHYRIVTGTDVIDILSSCMPKLIHK